MTFRETLPHFFFPKRSAKVLSVRIFTLSKAEDGLPTCLLKNTAQEEEENKAGESGSHGAVQGVFCFVLGRSSSVDSQAS